MPLPVGAHIGPYQVTGVLGAGGMGEVYRARDAKLNRDVALKILPDAVAADPDRRARFTREAQVLASLNHPNIAAIYGLEDSGSTHALVLEIVEGPTLADLMASGRPMPLADVLPIARQIADALEAAHEQSIVHRDLKPANVKVRADGTVKVLDFGLAKAMDPSAAASIDAMNSPTLTARATQLGTIIGTAAYMAPEQAKGKGVDKRADIWAFGVVLYEMLTGRRAFDGEDISTTLAAVLMKEPEWTALPSDTPAAVRRLIARCLERDPKARLRDIGEARVLLANPDAMRAASDLTSTPAPQTAPARHSRLTWLVATGGIVAAAAGLGVVAARWLETPRPAASRIQFDVRTPEAGLGAALSIALSPDGQQIAYVAPNQSNGSNVVWLRPIGDAQARELAGSEGATNPFWSPDSRRVAFAAAGKLLTMDVGGGTAQTLGDIDVGLLGGTWNREGTIVFAQGNAANAVRLSRVSDRGGPVTDVLKPDRALKQTSLSWPSFLPDGRHFLFLAWANEPGDRAIYAGSIDGGAPVLVVHAQSQMRFMDPGSIVYQREGTLVEQPFDVGALKVTADPVRIADGVLTSRLSGRSAFDISKSGVLIFRQGSATDPIADLVWVDRTGKSLGTAGDSAAYNQLRLSPDEKRVAVSLPNAKTALYNIWTLDLGNKILSESTFEDAANDPLWTSDGRSVVFESMPKGKRDFFQEVLGTRTPTLVFESPDDPKWLDDWSLDGKYLLFHLPRPGKLFALPLTGGDRTARLLAETPANFDGAHFSPDTKWVAYQSNETGEYEVWAAAFPAFDRRRRISSHGGGQAFWRGDGKELFYLTADGKMMSVVIAPGPPGSADLDFHTPVPLFDSPIPRPQLTIDQYAVTRDGARFLFIQPRRDQASAVAPITVIVNWRMPKS